jgi:hypothetical protein
MSETELSEAVHHLAVVFDRRKVNHALIGGLAVGLRSRPRATKDADFILNVPVPAFPGLLEDLVEVGFEIDVLDAVRRWSTERFLAFSYGRIRIDWMQPILPLYAAVLRTAEFAPWLDGSLCVATTEGLILTKIVAFRSQDQADIETLLEANGKDLDLDLIRREWSAVAKDGELRNTWLEDAIKRLVPPRPAGS